MITCVLSGGLGNNLFQLANIYNISKKYNVDYFLPKTVNRGDIGRFGQSTILEFDRLFDNKFIYDSDVKNSVIKRYIHHDHNPNSNFSYREPPFLDNHCYIGYFQSEKYFSDFDIKNEFILNSKIISELKNKYENLFLKKTIALHYRLGGDRVTQHMQHYHKNVNSEYYKKAIKEVIGDDSDGDYNILLFSDKQELAQNLLSNLGYTVTPIYNKDNVEDFIMMTICDNVILSNSTFSWWSAYMNNKKGKIVAPKSQWFGPGYKHFDLSSTFPDKWIKF
jgi:hypothetical protein